MARDSDAIICARTHYAIGHMTYARADETC